LRWRFSCWLSLLIASCCRGGSRRGFIRATTAPENGSEVRVGDGTVTCAAVRCLRPPVILREDSATVPLYEAEGRGQGRAEHGGVGAEGGGGGQLEPWFPKMKILGGEGEADVAWWDPRVGKVNRGTAGANCVLGMKIFLLHPQ
jgi:hypothetical protein